VPDHEPLEWTNEANKLEGDLVSQPMPPVDPDLAVPGVVVRSTFPQNCSSSFVRWVLWNPSCCLC
jgi:hypothetical protein